MSERKLDQIETMFKKTAQPKLEIEERQTLKKLGVILDNTPQGKIAMDLATNLASKVETSLDVIISEEYFEAFHMLVEGTKNELQELEELAKEKIEATDLYAKYRTVIATRVEQVLDIFEKEIEEEDKLGGKLVKQLEEMDDDIVILGVPLFEGREETEAENLGGYITKLLRDRKIHSNFLLVSDTVKPDLTDKIMGFVSIEQQPGSIVALTKRALSLSDEHTDLKLIGMIEEKTIETVARVDQMDEDVELDEEGNEPLDLDNASKKLEAKMKSTLSSIKINEEIPIHSFSGDVNKGSIATIVNTALTEFEPGLVLVRSVADIAENLDPIAEQITRIILRAGIPVLVVWD